MVVIDCTGGPPYSYDESANCVINPRGESLGFFPYSAAMIAIIKSFPETKLAIASRTTTPDWARKAIGLLRIPELGNTTLAENVDYLEIYPGKKSGIPCHEMLFFDDEHRNKEVTKLGVHFVKVNTQTGITPFQFENALHTYVANAGKKQSSVKDYLK
ncbi:hypothetical protein MFLAVUS_005151 [Mucor flavus]|uniref:Uncharacterized protein n=1 Tax=Mucor flavus TaxID=439312 RepID=A0ABP9YXW9_9FUNG